MHHIRGLAQNGSIFGYLKFADNQWRVHEAMNPSNSTVAVASFSTAVRSPTARLRTMLSLGLRISHM